MAVLPATSVHVPVTWTDDPSPDAVVDVSLAVVAEGVEITATAETTAQTGVEMEALVGATVAALTVYDMAKAVDEGMVLTEVTLVEKTKTAP